MKIGYHCVLTLSGTARTGVPGFVTASDVVYVDVPATTAKGVYEMYYEQVSTMATDRGVNGPFSVLHWSMRPNELAEED